VSVVAVITGGAGGMGLATARLLGRDHGVVLCDVDREKLDHASEQLRREGIECEGVVGDVTDRRSMEGLAERSRSFGPVVSLVHTAGVSPQMAAPERIIRVNALGTVHVNEAFLRVAGEGFRVVNVASTAGHLPVVVRAPKRAFPHASTEPEQFVRRMLARCRYFPPNLRSGVAYSLSKNFVIWYSRSLASTLGAQGGRIVSVSPGVFDTAMGRLEERNGAGALVERAAIKRYGKVEEIAEVLAFCASDRPGYLTGTDLLVDGGADAARTGGLLAMLRSS
jgi:NAD(P)-dependent dehydrogenase (short-subunit alcohol dehydrogenase family)